MDGFVEAVSGALNAPPPDSGAPADQGTPSPKMERPEPDAARKAHVTRLLDEISQSKRFYKDDFDRMLEDQEFAFGFQYPDQTKDDDRYIANLVQAYLRDAVASLYAKNPTATAKRRKTLDFALWDGTPESAQMAMQTMQQVQQSTQAIGPDGRPAPPTPQMMQMMQSAVSVLQDIQQGVTKRKQYDALGKTMVIMFDHELSQQQPSFKQEMKQLVLRVKTNNVGYVKLGFKRSGQRSPEVTSEILDMTDQLATIERLRAGIAEGDFDPYSSEHDQLQAALAALQAQPDIITREGLDFSFPDSTKIILDRRTKRIKGFVGTRWLAEEFLLSPADVKEIYKCDLGSNFTAFTTLGAPNPAGSVWTSEAANSMARVYEFYDKRDGVLYVLCEGHDDFLQEPAAPYLKLARFFPYYSLIFNMAENEKRIYPWSDVRSLRHIQREYNRKKEALRQHRIANRPLYVTPVGSLDEDDQVNLTSYAAHSVIELSQIKEGQASDTVLMPVKKVAIDPNVYTTKEDLQDMQLVGGTQGANLGSPTGVTATESGIANDAKMSSQSSNVDDLDELLTELSRDAAAVMLMEISAETVTEIVGPGAVWPVLTPAQIAKDVSLEIRAGSSGRPNQAADIAKFERMAPTLIQVPGVNPRWLAEEAVKTYDANVDLTDAVIEGFPAIIAMNAQKQMAAGKPGEDPNAQGPQGAANAPKGEAPPGPPQGLLPAPHEATPHPPGAPPVGP